MEELETGLKEATAEGEKKELGEGVGEEANKAEARAFGNETGGESDTDKGGVLVREEGEEEESFWQPYLDCLRLSCTQHSSSWKRSWSASKPPWYGQHQLCIYSRNVTA